MIDETPSVSTIMLFRIHLSALKSSSADQSGGSKIVEYPNQCDIPTLRNPTDLANAIDRDQFALYKSSASGPSPLAASGAVFNCVAHKDAMGARFLLLHSRTALIMAWPIPLRRYCMSTYIPLMNMKSSKSKSSRDYMHSLLVTMFDKCLVNTYPRSLTNSPISAVDLRHAFKFQHVSY